LIRWSSSRPLMRPRRASSFSLSALPVWSSPQLRWHRWPARLAPGSWRSTRNDRPLPQSIAGWPAEQPRSSLFWCRRPRQSAEQPVLQPVRGGVVHDGGGLVVHQPPDQIEAPAISGDSQHASCRLRGSVSARPLPNRYRVEVAATAQPQHWVMVRDGALRYAMVRSAWWLALFMRRDSRTHR